MKDLWELANDYATGKIDADGFRYGLKSFADTLTDEELIRLADILVRYAGLDS
jgi:hypothetical protein